MAEKEPVIECIDYLGRGTYYLSSKQLLVVCEIVCFSFSIPRTLVYLTYWIKVRKMLNELPNTIFPFSSKLGQSGKRIGFGEESINLNYIGLT